MSDLVGNPEDRFSRVAALIHLATARSMKIWYGNTSSTDNFLREAVGQSLVKECPLRMCKLLQEKRLYLKCARVLEMPNFKFISKV